MTAPMLVLGIGNLLLQDEGIGVRIIQALEDGYAIPPEIELLDGGTSGMELLGAMANRDYLIVVDAVRTGAPPGTIVQLSDNEVPVFFRTRTSPHEIGLSDVLATLQITDETPRSISLIGLVPASTELSLDLSDTANARFDQLLATVLSRLEELGYGLSARS